MKMNKMMLFFILLLGVILISACTYADIVEPEEAKPLTKKVNYNPDIKNIMNNYCITCHGGNAPSRGVDLSTYQNVKYYSEKGNLIKRINDKNNPMPPNGLMPSDKIQILQKWFNDNFPQ